MITYLSYLHYKDSNLLSNMQVFSKKSLSYLQEKIKEAAPLNHLLRLANKNSSKHRSLGVLPRQEEV